MQYRLEVVRQSANRLHQNERSEEVSALPTTPKPRLRPANRKAPASSPDPPSLQKTAYCQGLAATKVALYRNTYVLFQHTRTQKKGMLNPIIDGLTVCCLSIYASLVCNLHLFALFLLVCAHVPYICEYTPHVVAERKANIHAYVHTYTRTYIHTYIYTYIHVMHANIHMCMHRCMHIHLEIHIHVHVHIIRTHIQVRAYRHMHTVYVLDIGTLARRNKFAAPCHTYVHGVSD